MSIATSANFSGLIVLTLLSLAHAQNVLKLQVSTSKTVIYYTRDTWTNKISFLYNQKKYENKHILYVTMTTKNTLSLITKWLANT